MSDIPFAIGDRVMLGMGLRADPEVLEIVRVTERRITARDAQGCRRYFRSRDRCEEGTGSLSARLEPLDEHKMASARQRRELDWFRRELFGPTRHLAIEGWSSDPTVLRAVADAMDAFCARCEAAGATLPADIQEWRCNRRLGAST